MPTSDPLFDAAYYLAHNPDVAASGMDPYQHYLMFGWHEGRAPNAFFDPRFYLAQNPDVAASGMDPLAHYESFGWREGRQPGLAFDGGKYLAANPDVRDAGINPLVHYLQFGRAEGRAIFPVGGALPPDPLIDTAFYDAQLGASLIPPGDAGASQAAYSYDATGWRAGLNPDAWFDTGYYLAHNPDVAAAGINPLQHFETFGWKEGRDPSARFSVSAYLAANPDVAAAGIDPLVHFLQFGQAEGRRAIPVGAGIGANPDQVTAAPLPATFYCAVNPLGSETLVSIAAGGTVIGPLQALRDRSFGLNRTAPTYLAIVYGQGQLYGLVAGGTGGLFLQPIDPQTGLVGSTTQVSFNGAKVDVRSGTVVSAAYRDGTLYVLVDPGTTGLPRRLYALDTAGHATVLPITGLDPSLTSLQGLAVANSASWNQAVLYTTARSGDAVHQLTLSLSGEVLADRAVTCANRRLAVVPRPAARGAGRGPVRQGRPDPGIVQLHQL